MDRLDYTKGIPERLDAIDGLLTRRPELRGRFTFVQIGVPSRSAIASYGAIEAEIDRRVAALNARHAVPDGPPVVHYDKTALNLRSLVALYRLAHFCVVSSLHDGMNLVAKEFVAARDDEDGVLVLSELAGRGARAARRAHHQPVRRRRLRRCPGRRHRHAARAAPSPHARDAARRRRPERLRLGVGHSRGPREHLDEAAALLGSRIGGHPRLMPRNILTPRNLHALAGFAASNVLLAFDYDGTLAPIAATPAAARMRAETRRRLARVADRYPCVVISGRPLEDLDATLSQRPAVVRLRQSRSRAALRQRCARRPRTATGSHRLSAGSLPTTACVIEDKKYSVTVHYRHARNKNRVVEAIGDAVRELPDVRTVGGAKAINLLPRGGANKGVAVQRARHMFACDTVIYVGDDDTDEDAFVSAPPERLLSIRVGARGPTKAQYRLHSQRDVDRLLQQLLHFRTAR